MAANEVSIDVHDHGMALDGQKGRVKCNYCDKVISSGFSRLRYHLGGIRGDVSPCMEVPAVVKELMRNKLFESKRGNLSKEVGELRHPNLPWKRNWSPYSNGDGNTLETTQTVGCGSKKRAKENSTSKNSERASVSFSEGRIGSLAATNAIESPLSREAQKCIGRFFCESGINFRVAKSLSFQKMINATLACGEAGFKIPTCQGLKGWILQEEVKEMQQYVKKIRDSWKSTGCSVILDGWIDGKGQDLINVLVDCPQGPIYLRSFDISSYVGNVDAFQLFLDEVIGEVGVENVVQIVTYSASAWMQAAGKVFMEKHRTVFWTVSASHCIALMLEKIGAIDVIKGVLEKAKIITKFIYGHAAVLELLRYHTDGCDLIKPSNIKSAMPFLTIENIVSEKANLKKMIVSSEWNTSIWAASMEGKRVANLVESSSFWSGATMVLKATIPLVRALELINGDDEPKLCLIYETMDQVKETIKEEFRKKEAKYMPFWEVIDEIWNQHLHSPLHCAGYFLNPVLTYSSDFFFDTEVFSGLSCSIFHMVEDKHVQDLVLLQIDEYRKAKGAFGEGSAIDQRLNVPPAVWWSYYGGECPELQRLAIRVQSQTCDGASKYGLKRTLAEKLLTKGRNRIEQERLTDLTFVQYNMQLRNFKLGHTDGTVNEEMDPMDDWPVDEAAWMDVDCGDATADGGAINGEGPSTSHP
ncbi:uncharacterized protein LOC132283648 [Cornus florida]|uniref:uncharacterized protein LOC132283648 n=1 Tax=Cornus florida TaxID=4283 RepID=UPI00289F4602|nr:uncharacterized protein LOC132283648 [Cornus florida]XP_059641620.1 uncharacterized protein LOC132283648 [Cornus florida]XP_059641621.1 uncharacterized protein LOC132283648 [Cornus florida]XP_059641622.1 uncharacterized protein LOC132283648 [Cornus florida]XP_059641623.1 uncharacterized protein LOC132283648 [Cornus florida]XP_059641624.1 uncharacterized protein LOC132283648 [Cornus florida]XP_059641626.1 uncharacterized protein LOC132283648 [Cornus florida]